MKPLTLSRIHEIQARRMSEPSDKKDKVVDVSDTREYKITPKHMFTKMALYR